MAKSTQNVTLSPSWDIPSAKLVLSQANVRRIKAGISIEELAEDIARRGLLKSLSVRPVLADDGSETGKFEIPAGGRRFQALRLLLKQKRLDKTTPLRCIARDANSNILAEDDSLAENMQRAALHPLDQVRAFVALREKGQGDEEIAAAFFATPQVVKQRMKLAAVAPALLDLLVSEKLQAEAETIAAEGWKWIEVSLYPSYGYSHGLRRLSGYPAPMTGDEGSAHAKLLAEYRALEEEYEGQDDFPEEIDERLGEMEVEMENLETRPPIFDAGVIARAKAFVTLERYSELAVYRGFVRPEDEPRADVDVHSGEPAADGEGAELSAASGTVGVGNGTVISSSGRAVGVNVPEDEEDGALKPLPVPLVMELTAHRALALHEFVGRSPDIALKLLLLKFLGDTFRTSNLAGSCLEASVRHVYMSAQASDLKDGVLAKLVDDRHTEWGAHLPLGDDAAVWDYLASLVQGSRLSLLAHCLCFGINAFHEKVNPYGAGISASGSTRRMTQSDLVAQAVELDMVEAGWQPTTDTYLNSVPKERILEAVREEKGDGATPR